MPDNPMTCPSCGHVNPAGAKTCDICTLPLWTKPGTWDEATRAVVSSGQPAEGSAFASGALIANRYQVVRELGRGGMGTVYLVADEKLERKKMALKVILPSLVESLEMGRRFIQEVLSAQSLTHKSIVKVFHLDEYQGQRFFTMEYLPGQSLRDIMSRRFDEGRFFSIQEATAILVPVLSALTHAHSHNVIHRDLKPENIIIDGDFPDISVKVLDFGLARFMSPSRLTSKAVAMGTAYYMAPEQLSGGGEVDHRSDLFSVGVIMYELLTGCIPMGCFTAPSKISTELDEALDRIINRFLAQDKNERYGSADDCIDVLKNVFRKEHEIQLYDERIDIEGKFVEVAAGQVWLYGTIECHVDAFSIEQQPVSWGEFNLFLKTQPFLSDFLRKRIWTEPGLEYHQHYSRNPLDENQEKELFDQHVVGLHWCEAVAFCNWSTLFFFVPEILRIAAPVPNREMADRVKDLLCYNNEGLNYYSKGFRLPSEVELYKVLDDDGKNPPIRFNSLFFLTHSDYWVKSGLKRFDGERNPMMYSVENKRKVILSDKKERQQININVGGNERNLYHTALLRVLPNN